MTERTLGVGDDFPVNGALVEVTEITTNGEKGSHIWEGWYKGKVGGCVYFLADGIEF